MTSETPQGSSSSSQNISDVVKLVTLGEDAVLVAKLEEPLPDGTKITRIEVIAESPLGGGGNSCIIQFN
ncbi:MAG: hypothetical protein KME06_20720 [Kastovskya adunca ATA6-11-RM4]|jgi:hypothetical protein|nr:hypothetical protein [Kastovskya adunca ATA6-11-RM4]